MVDSSRAIAVVLAAVTILAVPAAAGAFTGTTLQQQEDPFVSDGIEVTDLDAPAEAAAGDIIEVSANVTLAEAASARNTTAEFRLDGDVLDEQDVSLSPGETTRVTFEVNTTGLEPRDYIHGILVEESGAQALITVFPADTREPETSFEVSNLSAPTEATAGETIQVSADVTSPANNATDGNATDGNATDGNASASTQIVTFRLNGNTVDEEFVTLAPGETTTVTFEITTEGLAPGTYFHGVYSDQFGEVAAIQILEADSGTGTPAPNVTETPAPTEAPNATETPAPTEAPNATETPAPTEAPNATETPAPTEAPNATETPAPTEAPNVTETPAPTEAPNATETPAPTEAPNATETPAPTEAPNATETPAPTETTAGAET